MDILDQKTPRLIIVRGIPGSGKSYLTAALTEKFGTDSAIILDPDTIPYGSQQYKQFSETLSTEGVDAKFHPFRWSRSQAFDAIIAGKTIIWNQAFGDFTGLQKTVESLKTYAQEQGKELPVLIVEVEVDSDIAKKRVAQRAAQGGHDVPEEAFDRFIRQYESFAGKGYSTVTVNGQNIVGDSIATILKAL